MRQPIWTPFEVALLIEAYWRIENEVISKKDAVSEISRLIRSYALNQGQQIDDTFRNENGISMRLEELRYLFSDGKKGIRNTSSLFRIMVQMYQQNPKGFQSILVTARTMYAGSPTQTNGQQVEATSYQSDSDFLLDWDSMAEIENSLIYYAQDRGQEKVEQNIGTISTEQVSNGISMVLEDHFSYGFKPDSVRDLMRFRMFAEIDTVHIPEDDDELKAAIMAVGTIIDGKLFVKSDDMSQELQMLIQDIFTNGTTVIYYAALLSLHADWMNKHHVTSESMLKDLLQKYTPDCYFSKRFMLNGAKQTEKEAVTAELQRVWGDSSARAVDDLSMALPYIPTDNIWRAISGSLYFSRVSEGIYFLNDRLIITEHEIQAILNSVDKECVENGYASLSDIPLGGVEEQNYEIPLNTIQSAIYGMILSNQYSLHGKILTKDHSDLNAIALLKQYLSKRDSCTFDELAKKNLELTGAPNRRNVFQALYDSMVRVDSDRFVSPNAVEFPIDEIDRILAEMITDHFCAVKDITTFALFPMCGQSWNHYLLESYCYRYSKRFSLYVINFNDKNAGIISEKDYGKNYIEMLAIAAAKTEFALTPEVIGSYLFQNGFTTKSKFGQLDEVTVMAKAIRKEP